MNIMDILKFICKHALTSKHKLKAIIFFLKWQIATRVLKKPNLIPWIDRSFLLVNRGDVGLTGNIYTGLLEYNDMAFLMDSLNSKDTFLDIGANAGVYTVLASGVVGAKTIAYEPILNSFLKLNQQVNVNNIQNLVTSHNVAIGNMATEMYFINNSDTLNRVSIKGNSENTELVKVVTLDETLKLDKAENYFVKIDVEGFEYSVLEGAKQLLSSTKVKAIIIEINDNCREFGHSNSDIHLKIIQYGFIAVEYDAKNRILSKLGSYNRSNLNTIYIKAADFSDIQNICTAAPKRYIHTPFEMTI